MESARIEYLLSFEIFRNSDNYKLYKKLRRFRQILHSLRQNYYLLTAAFKKFHASGPNKEFWNSTSFDRSNIQRRLSTVILNYLSSASSIIDISRTFSRNELDPESLKAYSQLIKEKYMFDIEFLFLKKIRNFVLHYSLLEVGLQVSMNHETGTTTKTYLSTERLLEWSDWNNEEKEFIKLHGKHLNFEPIIYRYHKIFLYTQDELYINILKKYKNKIDNLILEMEIFNKKCLELEMPNNLPFRTSEFRYLKYVVNKIGLEQ